MDHILKLGMLAIGAVLRLDDRLALHRRDNGMAYGTGLIKSRQTATILIAVFVLLGATFDSSHVVTTVGAGIIRARISRRSGQWS